MRKFMVTILMLGILAISTTGCGSSNVVNAKNDDTTTSDTIEALEEDSIEEIDNEADSDEVDETSNDVSSLENTSSDEINNDLTTDEDTVDGIIDQANSTIKSDDNTISLTESATPEEIFLTWIDKLGNEYDYESLFDTESISEEVANKILSNMKTHIYYKTFYNDDNYVITYIIGDNNTRGYIGLKNVNGNYVMTDSDELESIYSNHFCTKCNGDGSITVGTHPEYIVCSICGGSGVQNQPQTDPFTGIITYISMGCGACAGSGQIFNGESAIVETCDNCDGFGVVE